MKQRKLIIISSIVVALILIGILIYRIPVVKSSVDWRYDQIRTRIIYFFNPPDEVTFVPSEQESMATPTPSPTPTATEIILDSTELPPTQTPTATPDIPKLPESVILEDVVYVHQHERWNYCAPANLTMALKYWGWDGNRDQVALAIKPGENNPEWDIVKQSESDPNVTPYEMTNYVIEETEFSAILRFGGDIDLLRTLISNGIPVVIELGYYDLSLYTGKEDWTGHYLFVTGYDDNEEVFIVQDSLLIPGESIKMSYDNLYEEWRSFNFIFFVVFPLDQQQLVNESLGDYLDSEWAARHALEVAQQDIEDQTGNEEFFAWYNVGTSHVKLNQYYDAALAYDQAFALYAELDPAENPIPYRIHWYQTGPFWAYYYTYRYNDIINLAATNLSTHSKSPFEESYYWRGSAYFELGMVDEAIADFLEAIRLKPDYTYAKQALDNLGVDY